MIGSAGRSSTHLTLAALMASRILLSLVVSAEPPVLTSRKTTSLTSPSVIPSKIMKSMGLPKNRASFGIVVELWKVGYEMLCDLAKGGGLALLNGVFSNGPFVVCDPPKARVAAVEKDKCQDHDE